MNTVKIALAAMITALIALTACGCGWDRASKYETGTFIDERDGKEYRTVKIGELTWMAKNLNFETDSSWCYDDNFLNCLNHGRLYTWDAAMKACPEGWRLPDNDDWKNITGDDVDGKKLKSTWRWNNNPDGSSGSGTDNYGFSALPGGIRPTNGCFRGAGSTGIWWSAFDLGDKAGVRSMHSSPQKLLDSYAKDYGLSVRCIRKD